MRTIKLTIEYDGTNYCGWQIQPTGTSVQGALCRAVRKMTGEENHIIGASRTDAGVHALGQVAHFRTSTMIPPQGFMNGINSLLRKPNPPAPPFAKGGHHFFPPLKKGGRDTNPLPLRERGRVRGTFTDIVVTSGTEAPPDFHAQKDAVSKLYRYHILNADVPSALLANRCWHIRETLDIEAMKKATECLVGEHDFASFQAAGSSAKHAVRKIEGIEIKTITPTLTLPHQGGGEDERFPLPLRERVGGRGDLSQVYSISISGNGFVYHMVRNIVGTLVSIGKGRLKPEDMEKILNMRERKRAGVTAPAHGLYLVEVRY
jgi:tRNA pseudouridine38-40 synthase